MVRKQAVLPQLSKLPAAEGDAQELLYCFAEAVSRGSPCTFATFRELWLGMRFSHVFETRPLDVSHEDFLQFLFASALDCLEVPLRPRRSKDLEAQAALKKQQARRRRSSRGTEAPGVKRMPGEGGASSGQETAAASKQSLHVACQTSANLLQPGSVSLADLVDSDEEEDDELLQQVAQSLRQPGKGNNLCNATAELPKAHSLPANPERLKASALALLSEIPDLSEHIEDREDGESGEKGASPGDSEALSYEHDATFAVCRALETEELHVGEPNPKVVRIGCIFLLYGLYMGQPTRQLVRIYLPLHLLRGLIWMVGQSAGADAVLRQLISESAFVVGAVRRPISGTREAINSGRPVKATMATDRLVQRRVLRQALMQLQTSTSSWSSLQHVQLLCNSYKASQDCIWADQEQAAQAAPVFDLQTGEKLGALVSEMQVQIANFLPYGKRSKKIKLQIAQAASSKDHGKDKGKGVSRPAASTGTEERAKSAAEAAVRRRLREAQADEDDDMPSLDELGLSLPGLAPNQEEDSDSELQQMPALARAVEMKKQKEVQEVRHGLAGWKQAFDRAMIAASPQLLQHSGKAASVQQEQHADGQQAGTAEGGAEACSLRTGTTAKKGMKGRLRKQQRLEPAETAMSEAVECQGRIVECGSTATQQNGLQSEPRLQTEPDDRVQAKSHAPDAAPGRRSKKPRTNLAGISHEFEHDATAVAAREGMPIEAAVRVEDSNTEMVQEAMLAQSEVAGPQGADGRQTSEQAVPDHFMRTEKQQQTAKEALQGFSTILAEVDSLLGDDV